MRSIRRVSCRAFTSPSAASLRPKISRCTPPRRCYSTDPQSVVNGKTVIYCETPEKKQIWLVGTAHISKKSAEEVVQVIQAVKPDTVMVELDAARAAKLRAAKSLSSSSTAVSIFDTQAFSSRFGAFGAMPGFASVIKLLYDYLRALGLDPGLEMRAAMETAESLRIPILLGDQDATITSKKMNAAFNITDMFSLASNSAALKNNPHLRRLAEELRESVARSTNDPVRAVFTDAFIERLKDRDFVRSHMQAVGSFMPRLLEVLVHERDRYMVEKLQQEQGKRIVGVVGLGHLDGMEDLLCKAAGKALPRREFPMIA